MEFNCLIFKERYLYFCLFLYFKFVDVEKQLFMIFYVFFDRVFLLIFFLEDLLEDLVVVGYMMSEFYVCWKYVYLV